jgi:Transglycosylase SLT domain
MSYDPIILKAAQTYGLDPNLIRAQMSQESGGNNKAVSPKGAGGLMQLMPKTAEELGVTDRFDPEQNIMAGAKYLKQQFDKYGKPELALAAYNAGGGAVDRYGGIPPYKETRNYVKKIMSNYAKLAGDGLTGLGNAVISPAQADDQPAEELIAQFGAWKQAKQQPQEQSEPDVLAEFKAWKQAKPTKIDPTEGMSALDKGLAGVGSTLVDYGQGIGQMMGMVSPEDIAEKRRLDKALMDTTAGKVGGALGHVAGALPSVAIPGAATLGGAAKIGALYGALQPSESNTETMQNTAIGAGSNALGVGVGQALGKSYDVAEAIVNPLLTKKGVTSVANNTLERFAENPQAVRQAIKDAIEGKIELTSETGAKHTLAELTRDRGIATLQDALGAADPQLKSAIQGRLSDNMAGRVESLNKLAGTSAEREAALAARDAAAKPLYNEAFKKSIPITPELRTLLERPSVASALPRAAKLAKEEGRTFGFDKGNAATKHLLNSNGKPILAIDGTEGSITGQTLHDLKMGMDALLKDPNSGIAGQEINAVKSTRAELLKHIEDTIPDYGKARVAYSDKSNPINAMDIGEHITKKAYANIKDLGGNERRQANALSGLMKDPKRLIEQATGRKGLGKQLEKILSPAQMRLLSKVVQESDRASAIQAAGNGTGSATAQRTVATNILAQVLPKKAAGSNIAQTLLGKPLNLLYSGITEPKVQAELVDLLLNPQNAKLYTNKEFTNRIGRLLGVGGMSAAIEGSK